MTAAPQKPVPRPQPHLQNKSAKTYEPGPLAKRGLQGSNPPPPEKEEK